MNTHDNIIDNIDQYTARELVRYIRDGIITLEELQNEGLPKSVQDELSRLLNEDTEENDWQQACNVNTEPSYQKYLDDYPHGKHRDEAWEKKKNIRNSNSERANVDVSESAWLNVNKSLPGELQHFINQYPSSVHSIEARRLMNRLAGTSRLTGTQKIQRVLARCGDDEIPSKIERLFLEQQATENDLIEIFLSDHNAISSDVVSRLDGVLNFDSLGRAGINEAFIEKLQNDDLQACDLDTDVTPLRKIPDGFTEIYFWGVPASGKTCAVGSIMSTMTNGNGVKSVMPHSDSQGARYMMPLASSFREDQVCVLPPRTKVEETFEMRYTITDEDNREHGVAFIDLSGELFECMHISRTGGTLTPKQQSALKILNDILVNNRSQNPKIHFFGNTPGSYPD